MALIVESAFSGFDPMAVEVPSMKHLRLLTMFTQLALSSVTPLLLCVLGSRWLTVRFSLGSWVMAVGALLGVAGAVSGFVSALKQMQKTAEQDDRDRPFSSNDHL